MANILLSNQAMPQDQLKHQCSINTDEIYDDQNTRIVLANRPYLVNKQPSRTDLAILYTLRNSQKNEHLSEVALALGENNIQAISEIMNPINEQTAAYIGTSVGVYNSRMSGFQDAVLKYQNALIAFRHSIKTGEPKAIQQGMKQQVLHAHKYLQHKFQLELGVISNHTKTNKGSVLLKPTRGINIARSSRNAVKLNIADQTQAHNLVNFSKYARYLGNGLVILDFSSRIGSVHNSYRAGENWEREMFIESSSFVLGTSSGMLTASALSFLMIATPMGWIGLIIGGAVVAGASTGVSFLVNDYTKNISGPMYDQIIDFLQEK